MSRLDKCLRPVRKRAEEIVAVISEIVDQWNSMDKEISKLQRKYHGLDLDIRVEETRIKHLEKLEELLEGLDDRAYDVINDTRRCIGKLFPVRKWYIDGNEIVFVSRDNRETHRIRDGVLLFIFKYAKTMEDTYQNVFEELDDSRKNLAYLEMLRDAEREAVRYV